MCRKVNFKRFSYIRTTNQQPMGLFTKSIRRFKGDEDNANDQEVPGWLKMLQDNSWELEILISGGAIFSLFQLSGFTTDFFYQLSYTNYFVGRNILFMFSMLAIKGLTLGFAVHIIIRSFWVSLIALSSMFSDSPEKKALAYAKPFKADKSKLSDFIVKVDKLAGWMMYNSLTIVWIIGGGMLLMFALFGIAILMEKILPKGSSQFVLIPLALYYIDLFTFSSLRKMKGVAYVVYPFFILFDVITLRFIYQKGFDFIAKHVSRWKILSYYLVFICTSLLFTYFSIFRIMHWPNFMDDREYRFDLTKTEEHYSEFLYRNKTEDGRSHVANIQSDIISDPVLNLFINYSVVYDQFIDRIENENDRYFENIWQISVDDSIYTNLKYYTIHGNNSTTMGINTYIDIGNFNQGSHVLTITNIFEDPGSRRKKLAIPFWLDKESDQ
jgi:hypothetical protein